MLYYSSMYSSGEKKVSQLKITPHEKKNHEGLAEGKKMGGGANRNI